jgi:hypothetical protein
MQILLHMTIDRGELGYLFALEKSGGVGIDSWFSEARFLGLLLPNIRWQRKDASGWRTFEDYHPTLRPENRGRRNLASEPRSRIAER